MQEQSVTYRYDFLKYRIACLIFSILVLMAGSVAYYVNGGFKYHIDFTGGVELRISFAKSMDASALRSAMSADGWKDAAIQSVGRTGQEFLIRMSSLEENPEANLKASMAKNFPDNQVTVGHIEVIGAEVGKDTTWNAIKAVLLSLIILGLYIAIRSEFKFGMGAAIALVHDILVVMAYIVIMKEPISLHVLASVLALIGYSLNDTIVIFSRIQENFKKFAGSGVSDYDLVNLSINQTLTRTILTSFSTSLAVGSVLFLGGETLHGLAVILFIGIIVGTFSSIYIASPIMLWASKLGKKR